MARVLLRVGAHALCVGTAAAMTPCMHTLHRIVRVLAYPTVVALVAALDVVAGLALPPARLPLANLALSVLATLIVLALERLLPARPEWNAARGDVVADIASTFVVLPLIAAIAQIIDAHLVPYLFDLHDANVAVQALVALVVAELLFYGVHRASHRFQPLWRLHEVHHGSARLYFANSGRFHALDVLVQFPLYLAPLFLFGVSPQAISLFLAVNAVTGLFEHANVDVRLGALNFIFNGPELHRRHHAIHVRANFGKVLSIFDVLFGTFDIATRRFEVGTSSTVPSTFFAQLAHPFRARQAKLAGVVALTIGSASCASMGANVVDNARSIHADPPASIALDSRGRPRCLASSATEGVFLRWNEADRYARTIEAVRLPVACSTWHDVFRNDHHDWQPIARDALVADGVLLAPDTRGALAKIRRGALDLDVPSDVTAFTLATNVALTSKYGHGITGALYKRALEAKPANARARSEIVSVVDDELRVGDRASNEFIASKTKNVTLLVSMGFGWDNKIDEHTVSYVKDFLETVQGLGVNVDVLDRDPFGSLEGNTALLVPQLRKHLDRGENVVLMGLSKGTPEMLAAMSRVLALDADRRQIAHEGEGRVVGVVNMSGMMDGLIFGDWAAEHAQLASFTSSTLGAMSFSRSAWQVSRYAWVLPKIATPSVRRFNTHFAHKLPSDIAYLDVIGVVPDDGILKTDAGAMQPFIDMDRTYNLAGAANDGFVRYPGNETPAGVSPKQFQLVVDGSHMLFDGSFAAHSLQDPAVRRALLRAAVLFVTNSTQEAE